MSVFPSGAKSCVDGACFLEIPTPTPFRNVRSNAPTRSIKTTMRHDLIPGMNSPIQSNSQILIVFLNDFSNACRSNDDVSKADREY